MKNKWKLTACLLVLWNLASFPSLPAAIFSAQIITQHLSRFIAAVTGGGTGEHVLTPSFQELEPWAELAPVCTVASSAGSNSFTSSFPVCISFSSLIAVARTSKTRLNNSGERGHSCLARDVGGSTFGFSPLRTVFAEGLSFVALFYWDRFPLGPLFGEFLSYDLTLCMYFFHQL